MKASFKILSFLALTALVSCNRQDDSFKEEDTSELIPMIFYAYQEGDSAASKTSLSNDGKVIWNTDDNISVLYLDGSSVVQNAKFTLASGNGTTKGTFNGTVSSQSSNYVAVYPYQSHISASQVFQTDVKGKIANIMLPAAQTATEGSFDKEAALMITPFTDTTTFTFYHICSFLKITPAFNCTSITVEATDASKCLAGLLEIKIDGSGAPTSISVVDEDSTKGADRLILTGNIVSGKSYYLATVTQTTGQLKITYRSDGKVASETKGNNETTLKRRGIKTITAMSSAPTEQEFTFVDLGLSVKWASANIGATSETDAGEKYAWGELVPKRGYSWRNYKWGDLTEHTSFTTEFVTKYNATDSKSTLDASDDIANVLYGNNMHIPTQTEWQELINNCNWTYDSKKIGWTVTSNMSGYTDKSIFLPFSSTTAGSYWSSTVSDKNSYSNANYLYITDSRHEIMSDYRKKGLLIRPVKNSSAQ